MTGIVLTLVVLASADGTYFPSAVSWASFLLLGVLATLLLTTAYPLSRLDTLWVIAFVSLAIWVLANGINGRLDEAQRVILYIAGVGLAVGIAGQRGQRGMTAAVAIALAVVSGYALATRLFPERLLEFDAVAAYRLAEPLGYWNALGICCCIGTLLALGFVARSATLVGRFFSGLSVPLLAVAMYFTFSRGAWLALAVGAVCVLGFEKHRLAYISGVLIVAPFAAAGVLLASRQESLTTLAADLGDATAEGHRLAVWLVLLALGAGAASVAAKLLESRVGPTARTRRLFAWGLVVSTAATLLLVFGRFGGPWTMGANAWESFTSPPPRVTNLNERLLSFSANRRLELWQAAWDNYVEHPFTGSGAGSFEQYWLEQRDEPLKVRDAHSLYLETLSELGPLGLALLLLALGVPVYAAFKARGHPLVPAAFGAYVAYLVHAGVDWDWEMPAVTLTALFIGASIVVAARKPEDEEKTMSPRLRYGLLAGTLALAVVAFVGLVGNMALAQSADEARAGDWDASESKARRAETWAPWSPEPWQRIGEAQLGRGELGNARASFRQAIAKDERDWSLWLDLARASEGSAQLAALAQATKLNPLSPELAQLRKELAELGTIEVGG